MKKIARSKTSTKSTALVVRDREKEQLRREVRDGKSLMEEMGERMDAAAERENYLGNRCDVAEKKIAVLEARQAEMVKLFYRIDYHAELANLCLSDLDLHVESIETKETASDLARSRRRVAVRLREVARVVSDGLSVAGIVVSRAEEERDRAAGVGQPAVSWLEGYRDEEKVISETLLEHNRDRLAVTS